MYPRGNGPLISIILPTRGRPQGLREAVDSLVSLAKDQTRLEFLFRVDVDDKETVETALWLCTILNGKTIVGQRGNGYFDVWKHDNELAACASGDWLMIWSDDPRMLTLHWDEGIAQANPFRLPRWGGTDEIGMLIPRIIQREVSAEFPILRRRTAEILGHMFLHPAGDTYLYWMMTGLDAAAVIPSIEISHPMDEKDKTAEEGRLALDCEDVDAPAVKALIEKDRLKLKRYLEGRR